MCYIKKNKLRKNDKLEYNNSNLYKINKNRKNWNKIEK